MRTPQPSWPQASTASSQAVKDFAIRSEDLIPAKARPDRGLAGLDRLLEKVVDAGDYVVASVLARGVMKGTEDELEMRLVITYVVLTYVVRGGRIAEIRVFRNFADALEAAGLRE